MTFEELTVLHYRYKDATTVCKWLAEGSGFRLIIDNEETVDLTPSDLEALKMRYDKLADGYYQQLKKAAPGLDL